jgi:hypothetical protein
VLFRTYTTESGRYTTESGRYTTESGRYTTESGRYTTESGRYTTESGRYTTESGRYTTESGRYTTESGRYTTESGRYTTESQALIYLGIYKGLQILQRFELIYFILHSSQAWTGQLRRRCSIPRRVKSCFCSSPSVPTGFDSHRSAYPVGTGA